MKRSKITISIFCALALSFSSCSSDSDMVSDIKTPGTTNTETDLTFTGVIESDDATRVTMSNSSGTWSTVWNTTDGIRVFNSSGNIANFVVSAVDDNQVATFTRDANAENESLGESAPYYAVYSKTPSDLTIKSNGVISGSIPSVYTSDDLTGIEVKTSGGFNLKYRYMFAVADANNQFAFKNIMSFVRIKVKSTTNFPISMVKIVANNQEKIAGSFSANFNNGSVNIDKPTTGSSYIEIPVADDNNAHEYLIPIIPQTLSKGFTLLLETPFNKTNQSQRIYQRVMSGSFTFARNKVLDLGDYTNVTTDILENVVDLDLPSGTLWYTVNAFDAAATKEHSKDSSKKVKISKTDPASSFYAWGELLTKENQYFERAQITIIYPFRRYSLVQKDKDCLNYSWNYTYGVTQGSDTDEEDQDNSDIARKRSYKFGIGDGHIYDAFYSDNRYLFDSDSHNGVLLRYNSSNKYDGSITDWGGGVNDGKTILASDDDIVYQKSGTNVNRMCMPTSAQFEELGNLTIKKESNVFKLSSSNGRYITLPIGGYKYTASSKDTAPDKGAGTACYWTRELVEGEANSYKAKSFVISASNTASIEEAARCQGRMVRGVVLNSAIAPSQSYK